jgi:hypothetical protein
MVRRNLVALSSICLSIAVLLSTSASCLPGFLTQAHAVSQSVVQKRTAQLGMVEAEDINSFIIQMAGETATCRIATPDEVSLTIPSPDNRGVAVSELQGTKNQATINVGESENLTINLQALSQLQNDPNRTTVIAAFQRAAAIWTNRIKSPVTISLKIDYGVNGPNGAAFPSGVVGSTSSGSLAVDYSSARQNLIAGASSSGEAAIYNSLPANAVPVDTGDGSVVEVPRSIAQALGLVPANPDEVVATISFNKNFAFDFDPDNGIDSDKLDFVAVAAHEIGHSLGFISSNGEGSSAPVTTWDLFRFRQGTTPATFPTAQRIMTAGANAQDIQVFYTTQSFVLNGGATNELGLSTGGPTGAAGDGRQSSHWKADDLSGVYIGIMDPSISKGVHQPTTENDFSALEILGWNLIGSVSPPSPPPPSDNDNFANARIIVGCAGTMRGANLNATRETSEPNHSPDANGGTHSVWYSWRAPSTGSVTFTTAGSNFDTVLAVYSGSSVNALTSIVKNDDIPDVAGQPHQVTSSVTFPATAGFVYQIAVDGYNNGNAGGDMGPLKLNWTESSCTEPTPSVLTEESLTQAVALDSVTLVRGPFQVITAVNFSSDHHTRVILFTSPVGLFQPDASILSVQAGGMTLPVENVGQVFGVSGLEASYIVVRLPDGLQTGNLPVTVTLRGKISTTAATITIAP